MKTIAQQLNIKKFPFEIKDDNGNQIYYETIGGFWRKSKYDTNNNHIYWETNNGYWEKREFDSNSNEIYYETSDGYINDDRPKQTCDGKTVEIDGIEYELKLKN